jgi:hypothetical protein
MATAAHPLHAKPTIEGALTRRIIVCILIAIPISVAFWVGVMALAASFASAGYGPILGMAAGIGVLAGVFWGAWAGFASSTATIDDADRDVAVDERPSGPVNP